VLDGRREIDKWEWNGSMEIREGRQEEELVKEKAE
jgi:hypothetical protein